MVSGVRLMADVVEELPPRRERGFEPVEHRVEGAAEFGDVVVAAGLDPAAEITGGDRLGGLSQFGDRGEQTTGEHGGDAGDDEGREQGDDDVEPHDLSEVGPAVRCVGDDDEGTARVLLSRLPASVTAPVRRALQRGRRR